MAVFSKEVRVDSNYPYLDFYASALVGFHLDMHQYFYMLTTGETKRPYKCIFIY